MNIKHIAIIGLILLSLGIGFASKMIHRNDIQDFTVVQMPWGSTSIVDQGGYYTAFFPKTWVYRKVNTVYFSNEVDESKDKDGINVRFSNKGEGDISSQVVYRLYNTNEDIMKMHSYVAGSQDRVEDLILAKLKDITMDKAANITSSDAIENREELAANIRKEFVNNAELRNIGIVIEQFSITKINFDNITRELFMAQQRADLAKKSAEAEKTNLIMQKERTEAEAARAIAEAKGRAEVEKMKQTTDAQREAEVARINADREKVVAETEAAKRFAVAEKQRQTEEENLKIQELIARQKIVSAEAKQKEIELSGAITETERVKLEIEMRTKVDIAKAMAQGIAGATWPKNVIIGGSSVAEGNSNPLEHLIQLITIQKANEMVDSEATK